MIEPFKVGQKFHSKDKLGRERKFVIKSVEPAPSELYNNWYYIEMTDFKLWGNWVTPEQYRLETGESCDIELITINHVEQEWFNQRKITEIF